MNGLRRIAGCVGKDGHGVLKTGGATTIMVRSVSFLERFRRGTGPEEKGETYAGRDPPGKGNPKGKK